MKRTLLLFFSLLIIFTAYSQDFFNTDFSKHKKYVILCNPTVRNIQTMQFLTHANLLQVKKNKVKFVGVYFKDQKYDFAKTKKYIEENQLDNFFLHEIEGDLNENNLFETNDISDDLKMVFDNSIGVFFFGGPDIPPGVYGEENTHSVVTNPERHYYETTFLYHLLGGYQDENFVPFLAERPDYLVTGFCLGMQTMNVATGGTLTQDIPAELFGAETPEATVKIGRLNMHRNYWQEIVDDSLLMGINLHTIKFTDHPFFGNRVKVKKRLEPRIYSSHHQAADKLGKDLEVTCVSPDGKIVEGIAHSKYKNVFAVQFHPEVQALYSNIYVRKFHPDDAPKSYSEIIGKQSIRFHEKYWLYISESLKKVKKSKHKN
ncbi:gamma-glutamyl-gamma-aminobutyrate hydrolase family protein [Prolixibacteraceae bacterium Z1-6]|uniref:Gamma-glutamyl-gamma-aminobutyrate hydrolase family protein n=1 Tax=Draconibacterium aestuarii TaxID=2998507 RepID=A0A9X3F2S9_9BACT|nr:gamma-glutamyl-gamma-aminobutyrate hydrolase family protein [Prolixibacteraceae bacterium Z1-6]